MTDRPGVSHELHTILRVSNVGGREVRFHRDGSVLVWDGKLMRYRPLASPEEVESVRLWVSQLQQALEGQGGKT